MNIEIKRVWKKPGYTVGRLFVDGVRFCESLEPTDRGLEPTDRGLDKTMPLWKIKAAKIKGKTAIPAGTYAVTLKVQSPKFRLRPWARFCDGYLPTILGVPGFDRVLVHVGNSAADTQGCVLVGRNTEVGRLTQSTRTFWMLYQRMRAADEKKENISITIK